MPKIKRLGMRDTAGSMLWDEFVLECPAATFFHRAGWQRILSETFNHDTHFLYAEADGRIEGVLPLSHVKSVLFGRSLVSLPFAVYGGVAASTQQAADALEREAQDLAKRLGVAHLELRNIRARHLDWPTQDLYVTFRKPIAPDDEANMLSIPRKQRAMVRKGIKNGLRGEIDASIDRFYALYADNMHRHGTPALPMRYFDVLLRQFGRDVEVLTITGPDGRVLSSVLSFFFRDEVLPYYAGDQTKARDLAANDFKYWELMRRSAARGVKLFDYGRSKQGTGSFAFKKNWGFEPQALHYEFCLYKRESVPQNNPANPKYKWLIETWRHMPIGIANWLSPFIVSSLG